MSPNGEPVGLIFYPLEFSRKELRNMGHGVTRIRLEQRKGVSIVTAFGPSKKGRRRLIKQVEVKDGNFNDMIIDLLEELESDKS